MVILDIWFPFWSLEFWYVIGRRGRHDQPPRKTNGIESLIRDFLVDNISYILLQFAAGIKPTLCDFTRRWIMEAYSWFLLDFSHVPFPFADIAFHLIPAFVPVFIMDIDLWFSSNILDRFWYHGYAGLVKWVEKHSFFYFWNNLYKFGIISSLIIW